MLTVRHSAAVFFLAGTSASGGVAAGSAAAPSISASNATASASATIKTAATIPHPDAKKECGFLLPAVAAGQGQGQHQHAGAAGAGGAGSSFFFPPSSPSAGSGAATTPRIACHTPHYTTCTKRDALVNLCPPECPFVDGDPYFPCVASCVAATQCSHRSGPSFSFANKTSFRCQVCEIVGCAHCDSDVPGKCAECKRPFFRKASELKHANLFGQLWSQGEKIAGKFVGSRSDGSSTVAGADAISGTTTSTAATTTGSDSLSTENNGCTYVLETDFGRYFTWFILTAVALLLPATCIKMWRPVGRASIQEAIKNHVVRCKPYVVHLSTVGAVREAEKAAGLHQMATSAHHPMATSAVDIDAASAGEVAKAVGSSKTMRGLDSRGRTTYGDTGDDNAARASAAGSAPPPGGMVLSEMGASSKSRIRRDIALDDHIHDVTHVVQNGTSLSREASSDEESNSMLAKNYLSAALAEEQEKNTEVTVIQHPHIFSTDMHKDYVCGVGLALYYNWIVWLGAWGLICCVMLYGVKIGSDFAFLSTYADTCPTLRDDGVQKGLAFIGTEIEEDKNAGPVPASAAERRMLLGGHDGRVDPIVEGNRGRAPSEEEEAAGPRAGSSGPTYGVSSGRSAPQPTSSEGAQFLRSLGLERYLVAVADGAEDDTLFTRISKFETGLKKTQKEIGNEAKNAFGWIKTQTDPDTYFRRAPNVAKGLQEARLNFARDTRRVSYVIFTVTVVMLLWFAKYQQKETEAFDGRHANVVDFGVEITGLPPEATNPEEVLNWVRARLHADPGPTPEELMAQQKIDHAQLPPHDAESMVLNCSIAYAYEREFSVKKCGLTFRKIAERLLAREDLQALCKAYGDEQVALDARAQLRSPGLGDSGYSASDLRPGSLSVSPVFGPAGAMSTHMSLLAAPAPAQNFHNGLRIAMPQRHHRLWDYEFPHRLLYFWDWFACFLTPHGRNIWLEYERKHLELRVSEGADPPAGHRGSSGGSGSPFSRTILDRLNTAKQDRYDLVPVDEVLDVSDGGTGGGGGSVLLRKTDRASGAEDEEDEDLQGPLEDFQGKDQSVFQREKTLSKDAREQRDMKRDARLLRRCEDVGLVAPGFTETEGEEIKAELLQLKGSGTAFLTCNTEKDVDVVVAAMNRMGQPYRSKKNEWNERRFTLKETEEQVSARGLTPSGRRSEGYEEGTDERSLMDRFPALELAYADIQFARSNNEPIDVLWDNYSPTDFKNQWLKPFLSFSWKILFYALLMYTPSVVYTIHYLQEAQSLPTQFTVTLLGILFSSGNGVVGVMFYYYSETMPFRFADKFRTAIMLSYALMSLGNMAFSVYLVVGTSLTLSDLDVSPPGDAHQRAVPGKNLHRNHVNGERVDVVRHAEHLQLHHGSALVEGASDYSVGEETYLAMTAYELLVPGTFLVPYVVWTFTGYPLRRWLRNFNNFIPFSDDVRSARVIELRVAEKYSEPPMFYVAWDYAAFLILPLWCSGFLYLCSPQFQYLIFWNLVLFSVFTYWSQKILHLTQSKITHISTGTLSAICFYFWGLIVGVIGASTEFWQQRYRRLEALAVGEAVLTELQEQKQKEMQEKAMQEKSGVFGGWFGRRLELLERGGGLAGGSRDREDGKKGSGSTLYGDSEYVWIKKTRLAHALQGITWWQTGLLAGSGSRDPGVPLLSDTTSNRLNERRPTTAPLDQQESSSTFEISLGARAAKGELYGGVQQEIQDALSDWDDEGERSGFAAINAATLLERSENPFADLRRHAFTPISTSVSRRGLAASEDSETSSEEFVPVHLTIIDTVVGQVRDALSDYRFEDVLLNCLVVGLLSMFGYLALLHFVVRPERIAHTLMKDEAPYNYREVESRYGFSYLNTNPIMVLRNHFLDKDKRTEIKGPPLVVAGGGAGGQIVMGSPSAIDSKVHSLVSTTHHFEDTHVVRAAAGISQIHQSRRIKYRPSVGGGAAPSPMTTTAAGIGSIRLGSNPGTLLGSGAAHSAPHAVAMGTVGRSQHLQRQSANGPTHPDTATVSPAQSVIGAPQDHRSYFADHAATSSAFDPMLHVNTDHLTCNKQYVLPNFDKSFDLASQAADAFDFVEDLLDEQMGRLENEMQSAQKAFQKTLADTSKQIADTGKVFADTGKNIVKSAVEKTAMTAQKANALLPQFSRASRGDIEDSLGSKEGTPGALSPSGGNKRVLD